MNWIDVAAKPPEPGVPVLVAVEVGASVLIDVATRVVMPGREMWLTAEWQSLPPRWWQPLPDPPEVGQ